MEAGEEWADLRLARAASRNALASALLKPWASEQVRMMLAA